MHIIDLSCVIKMKNTSSIPEYSDIGDEISPEPDQYSKIKTSFRFRVREYSERFRKKWHMLQVIESD